MSWEYGEQFEVTAEHVALKWGGRTDGSVFVCGFCFHHFEVGDRARWIHADVGSNTFVCEEHDGPDASERWRARWTEVIAPILNRWAGR